MALERRMVGSGISSTGDSGRVRGTRRLVVRSLTRGLDGTADINNVSSYGATAIFSVRKGGRGFGTRCNVTEA